MKRRYHFGNASGALRTEMARIGALIHDLDRHAQLIECEIGAQEERAGTFNRSDDSYPMTARILAVRRDNLKATIAMLKQQFAALEGTETLLA